MSDQAPTTALVTTGEDPNSPKALARRDVQAVLAKYDDRDKYIMTAATDMTHTPAGTVPVVRRVRVNTMVGCYVMERARGVKWDRDLNGFPPHPDDQLSIQKPELMRMANALGIAWVVSTDVDECKKGINHPHRVKWVCVGVYRDIEGQVQSKKAHRTIDLRDDIGDGKGTPGARLRQLIGRKRSAQRKAREKWEKWNNYGKAKGWDEPWVDERDPEDAALENIWQEREFIDEQAETKAMLRVIREAAEVRQKYFRWELDELEFVFCKLMADSQMGRAQDALISALISGPKLYEGGADVAAQLTGQAVAAISPSAAPVPAGISEEEMQQVQTETLPDDDDDDGQGPPDGPPRTRSYSSTSNEGAKQEAREHQGPTVDAEYDEQPPHGDDDDPRQGQRQQSSAKATPAERIGTEIWPLSKELGIDPDATAAMIRDQTGKQERKDLNHEDVDKVVASMRKELARSAPAKQEPQDPIPM